MDDLDKKLEEIGRRIMALDPKADYGFYLPELLDQAKQAFIDDGWFKPADAELVQELMNLRVQSKQHGFVGPDSVRSFGLDLLPPEVNYDPAPSQRYGESCMTGQEWYDKFAKEWLKVLQHNRDESDAELLTQVRVTAKKAAGLE